MAAKTEPETAPAAGFGPLFRNPAFVTMWIGQVFSQVADKLVFILVVEIVGTITPSPTVMSAALAANTTPNMLLGALAGVLVDRLDKKRVMMASNLGRAVLVVALGVWGTHTLPLLFFVAFAISCCSQPFIPAEAAALPLVAGKELLLPANSLFATTMIGSIVVAFTIGEPLTQWLGTRNACFVTGAGFALSVLCLSFVKYRYPDTPADLKESFWTQLKEGFSFIKHSPAVLRTLAMQVSMFAMLAALSVLAIVFAREILHANFSWFLAMAGVGLGLGAWSIGQFGANWNKDWLIAGGFAGEGVTLLVLAITGAGSLYAAFGLAALIGLTASFAAVPLQTKLQELVAEDLRGKVFGAQNTLLNIATTLPLAGSGWLAERFGIQPVIGVIGGLILLVALFAGIWARTPVPANS